MFAFPSQPLAKPINCIQVTEVRKQENLLQLNINIEANTNSMLLTESTQYNINREILFQIKVIFIIERHKLIRNTFSTMPPPTPDLALVLFKFVKNCACDSILYSISCSSASLALKDTTYVTDNNCWYLVHEANAEKLSFDILLTSKIIKRDNPLKFIYDDTELTDLKLVGEGGSSVKVHSAVLMAQSSALKKMICEKTVKDGALEFSGFKEDTLKHFKDYIYLRVLPNDNLEQLLLMASQNSMPELKHRCIDKIVSSVTAKNIYHLTEFAQKHKIFELYYNLLECIQVGVVKVSEIKKNTTDS